MLVLPSLFLGQYAFVSLFGINTKAVVGGFCENS